MRDFQQAHENFTLCFLQLLCACFLCSTCSAHVQEVERGRRKAVFPLYLFLQRSTRTFKPALNFNQGMQKRGIKGEKRVHKSQMQYLTKSPSNDIPALQDSVLNRKRRMSLSLQHPVTWREEVSVKKRGGKCSFVGDSPRTFESPRVSTKVPCQPIKDVKLASWAYWNHMCEGIFLLVRHSKYCPRAKDFGVSLI